MAKCKVCGYRLSEGVTKCPMCGATVGSTVAGAISPSAKIKKSFYFGKHYDVIAWMPLPEPYRESEEQ